MSDLKVKQNNLRQPALLYPRHLRDLSGSLYYGVEWNIKLFLFNGDFHDYYKRSRNGIRKSSATRRWVHWSLVKFSCNIWNRLDISLKEAETLSSFFDYIRIQFLVYGQTWGLSTHVRIFLKTEIFCCFQKNIQIHILHVAYLRIHLKTLKGGK